MIRTPLLLRALALSAVIGPVSGAALSAAGDVPEGARREGVYTIGIPRAEAVRTMDRVAEVQAATSPSGADVRNIWKLGADGHWSEAASGLKARRQAYPGWKAPADLAVFIAEGQRDAALRHALEQEDWAATLAALGPPVPGRCEAPFRVWARITALAGLQDRQQLDAAYAGAVATCRDTALVAGLLARAPADLDTDGLERLASLPILTGHADPTIRAARRTLAAEARYRRFAADLAAGNVDAALALARGSDDPRLLGQAGWQVLATDAPGAADFFERALGQAETSDLRRGLVLAILRTGDLDRAETAIHQANAPADLADLAGQVALGRAAAARAAGQWDVALQAAVRAAALNPALAPDADALVGGALLDQAAGAYQTGDYVLARRLALAAASHDATRRAGRMRAAWADLQLGAHSAAASEFSALYLAAPDEESAEGFALAAEKTGDLDSAAAIARAIGGPLGHKVQALYADAAFREGDYLTARSRAPDRYETLDGIDRAWVRQAVTGRRQGGTRGENRLTGLVSVTSVGTSAGRMRFEGGVAVYAIDPGQSNRADIRPSRETVAAPYLAVSREGDTSLSARIGFSPLGGPASARIVGEVAVAHALGKGEGEARVFARPKTDSTLSLVGQHDAATGQAFGRVVETGAALRARMPVSLNDAVQADLEVTTLDGEQVEGNSRIGAGVSASRTLARDGFAYIATGPFYQFQSYDRNTNFHTFGHGGYFSPQAFHRVGWSVNAQTDPLKKWIVKADLAVAYESVREDAAPLLPRDPAPQPLVGGGNGSGVAGALEISAARRLGREFILSGAASAIASEAYDDVRLGIALTWIPGGRAGLVRADLPTDPFNPASWIQP
ncbi:cellulose synthase subunit BcsC-related outer membrane protein [Hyphomonas johnsonii]|uniref:Cellulose synthase operon C C-terminal domain-containing protein n=1 Tax=Hyphomonas johnsonii MHS-2 TaxID=1280950 RepID=A0A059FNP9_9PROT|nr:cellulose synthase subunit BcsC-related outer membrane protein [Hyphomonas johnsonii]KCZ92247.1 hypothetical protein HJO_09439 [Hyphomonas johnsonii MHS-2]